VTVTSDRRTSSSEVPDEPSGSSSAIPEQNEVAQRRRHSTPVAYWPTDEIRTALQGGDLSDWQAIVHALKRDPFGRTARQVEEVLESVELYGISTALQEVLARAREDLEEAERNEAAHEILVLFEKSGLRHGEFASRIGISGGEFANYLSGATSPTVAMLVRMRRVARRFGRTHAQG
jgi:predicted DNA-binding protein (UPF0251 family)